MSLQQAKKEQSSAQGCSQPSVADSAGECAASLLASASKAPRASDHKESAPEASLNFPVTRQDGHVDRRNAGRMSGTFCADPSEERSKIPHTSSGSSAQHLSVSSRLLTKLAILLQVFIQQEKTNMVGGIITEVAVPCFAYQRWSGTTNQTHLKSTTAVLSHKENDNL